MPADLTKTKIDKASEIRYEQELREALQTQLMSSAHNLDVKWIMNHVAPSLVHALSDLLQAAVVENDTVAKHDKMVRRYPALLPRREFNPSHWIASHLMRHNPKYKAPESLDYNDMHSDKWAGITNGELKNLKQMFAAYDQYNEAEIDVADLRSIIRAQGIELSTGELRFLIKSVGADLDQTGRVDFKEFVDVFLKAQEQVQGREQKKQDAKQRKIDAELAREAEEAKKLKDEEERLQREEEARVQREQDEAAAALAAKYRANKEQLTTLYLQYYTYDTLQDGMVTTPEVVEVFQSLGVYTDEEIGEFIAEAEPEQDGKIFYEKMCETHTRCAGENFEEIKAAVLAQIEDKRAKAAQSKLLKEIKTAFDALDNDSSGSIPSDLVSGLFETMGMKLTEQELESYLDDIDKKEKGTIEFNDFLQIYGAKQDALRDAPPPTEKTPEQIR